jgi:hypothetical protein
MERRRLKHSRWNIGLVRVPIDVLAAGGEVQDVTWVDQERGWYYADPFAYSHDGRDHLFFEAYQFASGRAVIGHADITESFAKLAWQPVLDVGAHASYPQILFEDGEHLMVAETSEKGEVKLFRAEAFPTDWRADTVLLPGVDGVDPTVFKYEGRWWLAATRLGAGRDSDLHLWHADALRGPWHPHAGNPVKRDLVGGRPAGCPFQLEGALCRPAQDCSVTYGGRVMIQRIDALDPNHYSETTVSAIEPDPNGRFPAGLHTVASHGSSTLIDGKRYMLSLRAAVRSLRQRASNGPSPLPDA